MLPLSRNLRACVSKNRLLTLVVKNQFPRHFSHELHLPQEQTNVFWNFQILCIFHVLAIFRSRAVAAKIHCQIEHKNSRIQTHVISSNFDQFP